MRTFETAIAKISPSRLRDKISFRHMIQNVVSRRDRLSFDFRLSQASITRLLAIQPRSQGA
ncbi:hypothetical protein [Almyronema epifaneia]|uniref:Transposase n=1 Tax=Almyronema epifaneia S1 TaxID=2991925 RepID=A0ABW6IKE5_9CYAN